MKAGSSLVRKSANRYPGIDALEGASCGLLISGASQDLSNNIWWPLAGMVRAMFVLICSPSEIGGSLSDALELQAG